LEERMIYFVNENYGDRNSDNGEGSGNDQQVYVLI